MFEAIRAAIAEFIGYGDLIRNLRRRMEKQRIELEGDLARVKKIQEEQLLEVVRWAQRAQELEEELVRLNGADVQRRVGAHLVPDDASELSLMCDGKELVFSYRDPDGVSYHNKWVAVDLALEEAAESIGRRIAADLREVIDAGHD